MANVLNKTKHEEQRQRLLAQARRLFASQGVKETSMAQIAKACKVTKAGIYHYFKGKGEILKDILSFPGEEIAGFRKRMDEANTLEKYLYEFAKIHLESMESPANLDLLKIMLAETHKNDDMKHFFIDFYTQNVTQCSKEIIRRFAPKLPEKEVRLDFYQFLASLLHYTWSVKMVGPMDSLIGNDEAFIRRLARIHMKGLKV